MVESAQFQSKILRRKTTPDEYRVYRAGLEWDLADPIIIETSDDLKSTPRWQERVEPYHHQVNNLITFCRRLPVTLLADDVGLGKTISAGLIISELISRSRLSKILVVCPKLLGPQWQEELLQKFDLTSKIAIGRDLVHFDPEPPSAVITTYASARLHLDAIPEDRFQMLVLDEAHKLRNLYGVDQPPQVALRFRDALEQRRFPFVLMLTATPIQNRLWDLYSLVELLTVARGHENPFGSPGIFARRFIADQRDQARQLKAEAQDEFRSIVYGYMSRVRRDDARLYFPERVVQMHRVEPTMGELEIINAIARPIQELNRLSQISILQALTSSPHALMAQLNNMARNGTVPKDLAATVRNIVNQLPITAKLKGLELLITRLQEENPTQWRLVVFTGRIETQTTIQAFLEGVGLKVGIINGMSGPRNQDTIRHFRQNAPKYRVIVSTEAGSEGVNLQVANVMVNFDLPWNPMIVEQRIGRIQRLASEHENVAIFNIVLSGTFEEYIVGRLMEKLQMASHAIGDIEALLEATGIGEDDDEGAGGFDERIRKLVLAALAGKDVEEATKRAEASINKAKETLEREEENINAMLGSMNSSERAGPRAPKLPSTLRSMEPREFTLAAFKSLGAQVTAQTNGLYVIDEDGGREHIRFSDPGPPGPRSTLFAPSTAAFDRLVARVIATGVYDIDDLDRDTQDTGKDVVDGWVRSFGATPKALDIEGVELNFEGTALVRARATVAHDSYERLVEITCPPTQHKMTQSDNSGLAKLPQFLEDPANVGVDVGAVATAARTDPAISEFCRFYVERRAEEVEAAGSDPRKRKKLEDEFTPRIVMSLVALQGKAYRELRLHTRYLIDDEAEYDNHLRFVPHTGELLDQPDLMECTISGATVPSNCLEPCAMTSDRALRHVLAKSEISHRYVRPELAVVCSLSGKRILKDEAEISDVSGKLVTGSLLKASALSGKQAEPEHFGRCEFTSAEVLKTELGTSEASGSRYRIDEQVRSAVSGKVGHTREFIECYVTRQPLLISEAEQCEITGHWVRPGVLEQCAATGRHTLKSELEVCAATGTRAIKSELVASSISQLRILQSVAVRSFVGKFCTPTESIECVWTGRRFHPDDIRTCQLSGLPINFEYSTSSQFPRLRALVELLDGAQRSADASRQWETISSAASSALNDANCTVDAAVLSPSRRSLAVVCSVRTLLGLRTRHAGFLYSFMDHSILGRISLGRRTGHGWAMADP